MSRTFKITIFPLILAVVLGLLTFAPASAQWRTQKTSTSAQEMDLSVSPSRGPADAPVEIAVFSCFE